MQSDVPPALDPTAATRQSTNLMPFAARGLHQHVQILLLSWFQHWLAEHQQAPLMIVAHLRAITSHTHACTAGELRQHVRALLLAQYQHQLAEQQQQQQAPAKQLPPPGDDAGGRRLFNRLMPSFQTAPDQHQAGNGVAMGTPSAGPPQPGAGQQQQPQAPPEAGSMRGFGSRFADITKSFKGAQRGESFKAPQT